MTWKTWNGHIVSEAVIDACDKGTEDAAQAIKGQSLQEVPHDSGFLSQSIIVVSDPGNRTRKLITAGGGPGTGFPVVPYAFKWHELREKTTGRTFANVNFQKGRKSNYLRDPLNQVGPRALLNALTQRLRGVL